MTPHHPPGGYVDRVNDRIAADRRVLAEARRLAKGMDRAIYSDFPGWCPWCGVGWSDGPEVKPHYDGCEMMDLLAVLRKEPPS